MRQPCKMVLRRVSSREIAWGYANAWWMRLGCQDMLQGWHGWALDDKIYSDHRRETGRKGTIMQKSKLYYY